jgi:hypothetical protein
MRIYVIVAKNIDLPGQPNFCMSSGRIAAHVAHAVLKMEEFYSGGEELWDCEIIILSVPNSSQFQQVQDILTRKSIPFASYLDTDRLWEGEQLTAICTFPITKEQGNVLGHLRPWKCACNDLRSGSSEKEHRIFNPGVAGSIPAPSAKSLSALAAMPSTKTSV